MILFEAVSKTYSKEIGAPGRKKRKKRKKGTDLIFKTLLRKFSRPHHGCMDDTEDIDDVAPLDVRQNIRERWNNKLSCVQNSTWATKVRLQSQQLRTLPNSLGHIASSNRIVPCNVLDSIIEIGQGLHGPLNLHLRPIY